MVDLVGLCTTARSNPRPTRPIDDVRIGAFAGGHGLDDPLDPVDSALVDLGVNTPHLLGHAGDHAHHVAQWPHLPQRLELFKKVVQGKRAFHEAPSGCLGLDLFEVLLSLLDEGLDIAHPKNPAGQAVRMERFEVF